MKGASSTSALEQGNHSAAFQHLQHLHQNEDIDAIDGDFFQPIHPPQQCFKTKYRGNLTFINYIPNKLILILFNILIILGDIQITYHNDVLYLQFLSSKWPLQRTKCFEFYIHLST